MNNHILRFVSAVCTASLLLCGCAEKQETESGGDLHITSELEIQEQEDRETDISKRFPEFFKYCFGEDATYTYLRTDPDDKSDYYMLTYHDSTGTLRRTETYSFPYGEEQAEQFPTEEMYYAAEIECLAEEELEKIFRRGFFHDILEKHLEGHGIENESSERAEWESDNENVLLLTFVPLNISGGVFFKADDPVVQRITRAHIEPGTGWQVCTADWKTIAADEDFYTLLEVRIPNDADADAYGEKLRQIAAEYRSFADEPQSFTFALKQDDSDPESTAHSVLLISYIMDEEIDRSKMDADYTGLNHYTEKMIEKYRND